MKILKRNENEDKNRRGIVERLVSLPSGVWITVAVALAVLGIVRRYVFNSGCLMRELIKVPCPACGMSRALLALVRLDIAKAFEYHPVFWVFPIACLSAVLCALDKKRRRAWTVCFIACAAIFIACWVIRLATGTAV